MMESITLTLNGKNSVLNSYYHPEIELSSERNYVLALVHLLTFHSIPNIDVDNNKFYYDNKEITIPTGVYEIKDIESFLKKNNINIEITMNPNTLKSYVFCNKKIDFTQKNTIARLLGFNKRILEANVKHESDMTVHLIKWNSLRVECNIITNSFINDERSHTIHEFHPQVDAGYKIIETPKSLIYLPVSVRSIDHLEIKITDQDGNLINNRGENISVRLHLKSV